MSSISDLSQQIASTSSQAASLTNTGDLISWESPEETTRKEMARKVLELSQSTSYSMPGRSSAAVYPPATSTSSNCAPPGEGFPPLPSHQHLYPQLHASQIPTASNENSVPPSPIVIAAAAAVPPPPIWPRRSETTLSSQHLATTLRTSSLPQSVSTPALLPDGPTPSAVALPPPRPEKSSHARRLTDQHSTAVTAAVGRAVPETTTTIETPTPPPHYPEQRTSSLYLDTAFGPPRLSAAARNEDQASASVTIFTSTGGSHRPVMAYETVSARLCSGDLIDLGSPRTITVDDIGREFDPLYARLAAAAAARRRLESEPSTSAIVTSAAVADGASTSKTYDVALRGSTVPTKAENGSSAAARPCSQPMEGFSAPTDDELWLRLRLQDATSALDQQLNLLRGMVDRLDTEHDDWRRKRRRFRAARCDELCAQADSIKVTIETDDSWAPELVGRVHSLTCDVRTGVDVLLAQALALFLPDDQNASEDDYVLRVHGVDEELEETAQLGQHLFVGVAIGQCQDVELHITRIASTRRRKIDNYVLEQCPKFARADPSSLTRSQVQDVLDAIRAAVSAYERILLDEDRRQPDSAAAQGVRQSVKLLCRLLNGVVPATLDNAVSHLLKSPRPDDLASARYDLVSALHQFVTAYVKSSHVSFQLPPFIASQTARRVLKVTDVDGRITVKLNSIHNIKPDWQRFHRFNLLVSVYHGRQKIACFADPIVRTATQKPGLFPTIVLESQLSFHHPLCTYPLESRIVFTLMGLVLPSDTPSTNSTATPSDLTAGANPDTQCCLAQASLPIYDWNRRLLQGTRLVALSTEQHGERGLRSWGSPPVITASDQPVLLLTLNEFGDDIEFPHTERSSPLSPSSGVLDSYAQDALDELLAMSDCDFDDLLSRQSDEADLLWQWRTALLGSPSTPSSAIVRILSAAPDWGPAFLPSIYALLDAWHPAPDALHALQLLMVTFPDERVRERAVHWLQEAARTSPDVLLDWMPQLVELVSFETHDHSPLAALLLHAATVDRRAAFALYWQLQQHVDHCTDAATALRSRLLQSILLEREGANLWFEAEIRLQHGLLSRLDSMQDALKASRKGFDKDREGVVLCQQTGMLDSHLLGQSVRLPLRPSVVVDGVHVSECAVYSSFARPVRVVFRRGSKPLSVIHKIGDDLRQDALVQQLIRTMRSVWLAGGLDLHVITYECMPTGASKGLVEVVPRCATLCDIQLEGGVKGVFSDRILHAWLVKYNTTEFEYKRALSTFLRSCAAWCVASYVLGIGDRHNDNILITRLGHVFHIDYGKYLGNKQTAAGFSRDRVPFVFTKEMFCVVNEGQSEKKERYQEFVDLCCRAFNLLRSSHGQLTQILRIMGYSSVAGMGPEAVRFVENNLFLELTDTEATTRFTRMIEASLKSLFPRFNFFAHSVAQLVSRTTTSSKDDDRSLSFSPVVYSEATDGRMACLQPISVQKCRNPEKIYLYEFAVLRSGDKMAEKVFRSFDECIELVLKMDRRFPGVAFPTVGRGGALRTNISTVAHRRLHSLRVWFEFLESQSEELKHADLVYTFCHPQLIDHSIANGDLTLGDVTVNNNSSDDSARLGDENQACELHISMKASESEMKLLFFIGHARRIATVDGRPPDSYVKIYLRPDVSNSACKRKTAVQKQTSNPTFNETLSYTTRCDDHSLNGYILEVTVWHASASRKILLHQAWVPLARLARKPADGKGRRELTEWFSIPRNKKSSSVI